MILTNYNKEKIKKLQLNHKKILEPERFIRYEKIKYFNIIQEILNLINKDDLKLCDIGGGRGALLNKILISTKYKLDAYIMEIEEYYRDKLICKNINFINRSILDNKIDNNYFDIVIFRELLHHLVSNNIKKTLLIQKFALNEIFRITKGGGYIVFIEMVNPVKIFAWLIYLFSKLANRYNIKLKLFFTGTVIVSFLNRKKIKEIINQFKEIYDLKILIENYKARKDIPIKWKITLLMSRMGLVFYVIKVLK